MRADLENLTAGRKETNLLLDWGKPLRIAVCENCDWQFLFQEEQILPQCPHCFKQTLVDLSQETLSQLAVNPPELILSSSLHAAQLAQQFQAFSSGYWFPPYDLKVPNLLNRLVLLYLPIWLVDSTVQATWKAEAGFNYQVVSHQDRFDDRRGGWSSQEVQETRVRWEPRLGQLQRSYQNITAPALNEHFDFIRRLGQFNFATARPYASSLLPESTWVACLPTRGTVDAWSDAVQGLQSSAVKECQQACRADHLREFTWQPEFSKQNWTLLLVPVYATFYLDDEQKPQPILVNGQSGKLNGSRRASLQRAQKTSLLLAGVAIFLFLVGLILSLFATVLPFLLVIGGIGIALALLVGLFALVPLITVWRINQKQRDTTS